jgi:hypothetical protein
LMMSYVKSGDQSLLSGIARVTVSIDLFLVSWDVCIEFRKDIAGSKSQPQKRTVSNTTTNRLNAAASRGSLFQLAAQNQTPSSEPPIPRAYFSRTKNITGRFSDVREWDQQYWSQFAF